MGNISDSVIARNRQSMLFWRKGKRVGTTKIYRRKEWIF